MMQSKVPVEAILAELLDTRARLFRRWLAADPARVVTARLGDRLPVLLFLMEVGGVREDDMRRALPCGRFAEGTWPALLSDTIQMTFHPPITAAETLAALDSLMATAQT